MPSTQENIGLFISYCIILYLYYYLSFFTCISTSKSFWDSIRQNGTDSMNADYVKVKLACIVMIISCKRLDIDKLIVREQQQIIKSAK